MSAPTFDLRPLMAANMACTMAMMAFVSLIGPIARVLGLATWQAGAAVTVSGVIWMVLARRQRPFRATAHSSCCVTNSRLRSCTCVRHRARFT